MAPRTDPESRERDVRYLRRDITPFLEGVSGRLLPLFDRIVENPDRVLSEVAQEDESLFRRMEAEPALRGAKKQRVMTLVKEGFLIEAGDGPRGEELQKWTKSFLGNIKMFRAVLMEVLETVYWGWRPMEVKAGLFTHEGKLYWGPRQIRGKMPERFRFTTDRDLAWLGNDPLGVRKPRIFKTREHERLHRDKLKFWVCTYGDTDNPYGHAVYREAWLIWFLKSRFWEMFSVGMGRSMGFLKVSEAGSFDRANPTEAQAGSNRSIHEVASDLRLVLEFFHEENVLVEAAGWKLDLVSDITYAEGWLQVLEYMDRLLMLSITTEHLTLTTEGSGARAAVEGQRLGMKDVAAADGVYLEGWVNSLIRDWICFNFGAVTEADLPTFRAKLGQQIDKDLLRFLYDAGAPIDGRAVAAAGNVPLLLTPQEGDLLVQRGGDAGDGPPDGPPDEDEDEDEDESGDPADRREEEAERRERRPERSSR